MSVYWGEEWEKNNSLSALLYEMRVYICVTSKPVSVRASEHPQASSSSRIMADRPIFSHNHVVGLCCDVDDEYNDHGSFLIIHPLETRAFDAMSPRDSWDTIGVLDVMEEDSKCGPKVNIPSFLWLFWCCG